MAEHRRMIVVSLDTLREIAKLAKAACKLHEGVTHYGKCDICELVDKWRRELRDDVLDVRGIREYSEHLRAKRES
jgi:hypothetical protein